MTEALESLLSDYPIANSFREGYSMKRINARGLEAAHKMLLRVVTVFNLYTVGVRH